MQYDPLRTPAATALAALRDGGLTAGAIWEAAEDRHRRYGEPLNAYKTWLGELARAQAVAADAAFRVGADLGPAQGIPVSVKDVFGLSGAPVYAGTSRPLPARYEQEGDIVRGLRNQLALFAGKAHTVPFAFGGSGGSSSGAGVSLWEASCFFALGSDAGGSLRMPASLTGTVALKPSRERWPRNGAPPLSPTLDSPGLLARSVADLAVGFAAIDPSRPDWRRLGAGQTDLAGLTFGIAEHDFFAGCDDDVQSTVLGAARSLEAHGARLREIKFAAIPETMEFMATGSVGVPEGFALVSNEFADWIPDLDANVWHRLKTFGDISAAEYRRRLQWIATIAAAADLYLEEVDAVLLPTTACTAPILAAVEDPAVFRSTTVKLGRNCGVFNVWDLPALSMPVGADRDGLPVGMQIVTRRRSEETLLAIAGRIERIIGRPIELLGAPPLCP